MLQTDRVEWIEGKRRGEEREDELRMRMDVSPWGNFSMNASKRLTSELRGRNNKTAYLDLIFGMENPSLFKNNSLTSLYFGQFFFDIKKY